MPVLLKLNLKVLLLLNMLQVLSGRRTNTQGNVDTNLSRISKINSLVESNLSKDELIGLHSLKKKVANNLIIANTDKSTQASMLGGLPHHRLL